MEELIVISRPELFPLEHAWINKMFDAGLELLHLRKHGCRSVEIAGLLDKIDKVYYDRIALHQYHELAGSYGIRRLHFPEKERHTLTSQENAIYSTSVHSIDTYKELAPAFSYTFISPIFNSISKEGYVQNIDPTKASKAKKVTDIVALGGINSDNCLVPFRCGFDSVAVLGAIWENTDPLAAFKQLYTCITTGQ